MSNSQVLILAGGKGTRLPQYEKKELIPINGKPIIKNLTDNIKSSGVSDSPVIVVGYKADLIKDALGNDFQYILQEEQLGTGNAVRIAKDILKDKFDNIIVLYGDHAFIKPETIKSLNDKFLETKPVLSLVTVKLPDFEGWHSIFLNYGRIVRDEAGNLKSIIEARDTNEEQAKITEVNPGYYCFESKWLWENIEKISNNNTQKEYYLTDLVEMAFNQGQKIESIISHDPIEGLGINTPDQLAIAQRQA